MSDIKDEPRDKNGDTFKEFLKKATENAKSGGSFEDMMEDVAIAAYVLAISGIAKDMGIGRQTARRAFDMLLKSFDSMDEKQGVKDAATKSGSFVVAGPTSVQ